MRHPQKQTSLPHLKSVSKARHSALDAESPEKRSVVIMGLRVKPAMTLAHLTLLG
jgi:hypothetical protein